LFLNFQPFSTVARVFVFNKKKRNRRIVNTAGAAMAKRAKDESPAVRNWPTEQVYNTDMHILVYVHSRATARSNFAVFFVSATCRNALVFWNALSLISPPRGSFLHQVRRAPAEHTTRYTLLVQDPLLLEEQAVAEENGTYNATILCVMMALLYADQVLAGFF
jgi:hypothetical protein